MNFKVIHPNDLGSYAPDEVNLCVCVRVKDLKHPALGSTQAACYGCGDLVWVGPKSSPVVAAGDIPVVCEPCLGELVLLTKLIHALS